MKADIFTEIFLWNKNVDSLIRVLQRMEALGIWTRREMNQYETRLEELRANLNADFGHRISSRERLDQQRYEGVRLAAERNGSFGGPDVKQTKQTNQRNH
ncbi:MAG: hypothetical protein WA823_14365 [Candidatus Acidiferrales bacterium]